MVIGSRVQLLGRRITRSTVRHYAGRIFATCASLVLGLPVYDTQCGAKLFRATPVLACILDRPFTSHWIFADVELLARYLDAARTDGHRAPELIYELALKTWATSQVPSVPLTDARGPRPLAHPPEPPSRVERGQMMRLVRRTRR
jgi:hypothetical protein